MLEECVGEECCGLLPVRPAFELESLLEHHDEEMCELRD